MPRPRFLVLEVLAALTGFDIHYLYFPSSAFPSLPGAITPFPTHVLYNKSPMDYLPDPDDMQDYGTFEFDIEDLQERYLRCGSDNSSSSGSSSSSSDLSTPDEEKGLGDSEDAIGEMLAAAFAKADFDFTDDHEFLDLPTPAPIAASTTALAPAPDTGYPPAPRQHSPNRQQPPLRQRTSPAPPTPQAVEFIANLSHGARKQYLARRADCKSAAAGEVNQLSRDDSRSQTVYRAKKARTSQSTRFPVYALAGSRVCVHTFAAVYKGEARGARLIVNAFLRGLSDAWGLAIQTGKYSKDGIAARFLPTSFCKADIFRKYLIDFENYRDTAFDMMSPAARSKINDSLYDKGVPYRRFVYIWNWDNPTLRIASSGSDYCDFCTRCKSRIAKYAQRKCFAAELQASKKELEDHRAIAQAQFDRYKKIWQVCSSAECPTLFHYVVDYAEKIKIPTYVKQPAQLHFVTPLKFDLNGNCSAKTGTNY
eukprot:IDg1573t1